MQVLAGREGKGQGLAPPGTGAQEIPYRDSTHQHANERPRKQTSCMPASLYQPSLLDGQVLSSAVPTASWLPLSALTFPLRSSFLLTNLTVPIMPSTSHRLVAFQMLL